MLPFVVCNSLPALPHPTSIGAVIIQFDLSPPLMLLVEGSPEVLVGFLISFWVIVPLLESVSFTV
jgi:hypothetical protein